MHGPPKTILLTLLPEASTAYKPLQSNGQPTGISLQESCLVIRQKTSNHQKHPATTKLVTNVHNAGPASNESTIVLNAGKMH
jgi:hypothetical protein